MQIKLISLARAPERREAMIRKLSEKGLDYRLIEAVDGAGGLGPFEWDPTAFRAIYGRDILSAEIGCYHSHLKALCDITGTCDSWGVVLEDDVAFYDNSTAESIEQACERAVQRARDKAGDDWAMILPGSPLVWSEHRYTGADYTRGRNSEVSRNYCAFKWVHQLELRNSWCGTQFYIVNVNFASYIVDHWKVCYRPIDELYKEVCKWGKWRFFHMAQEDWWCHHDMDVSDSYINVDSGRALA